MRRILEYQADQLEMVLYSHKMPDQVTGGMRVHRQGGRIHVEVPRQEAEMVRLVPLSARLGEIPRQAAVLGLDDAGVPLLLRLPSPEVCHVLVAGTTGSGKTALARTMVVSLADPD